MGSWSYSAAFLCVIWPAIASAQDATLLVSRNTSVTSFYLQLPADDLPSHVAASLETLPDTATFADAQTHAALALQGWAAVLSVTSNSASIALAPLPALLHRTDDPLPFATPVDASVASAFCATPSDQLPPLSSLTLYSGLRATLPLSAPLDALVFAPQPSDLDEIQVVLFERGTHVATWTASLPDTGILSLRPPAQVPWPIIVFLALAMASVAITARWVRRTDRRPMHVSSS